MQPLESSGNAKMAIAKPVQARDLLVLHIENRFMVPFLFNPKQSKQGATNFICFEMKGVLFKPLFIKGFFRIQAARIVRGCRNATCMGTWISMHPCRRGRCPLATNFG